MTSVPRDPVFWKRFSTAVHLSEGKSVSPVSTATLATENPFDNGDSWLQQQSRKKRRNRLLTCATASLLIVVLVLFIMVIVNLSQHGWYMHGEKFSFP